VFVAIEAAVLVAGAGLAVVQFLADLLLQTAIVYVIVFFFLFRLWFGSRNRKRRIY